MGALVLYQVISSMCDPKLPRLVAGQPRRIPNRNSARVAMTVHANGGLATDLEPRLLAEALISPTRSHFMFCINLNVRLGVFPDSVICSSFRQCPVLQFVSAYYLAKRN